MIVLEGLDENYDNVFSTLTKMMCETIAMDDARVLLLRCERRIGWRKVVQISPLPNINLSNVVAKDSQNEKKIQLLTLLILPLQQCFQY